VDGGGWLSIGGTAVDWIYRDLDRVICAWNDADQGTYQFHAQTGHPLGFPDFAYAGELALGVVLADLTGELAALRDRMRTYPDNLRRTLVTRSLWEASFLVDIAHKAVARTDTTYVGVLGFSPPGKGSLRSAWRQTLAGRGEPEYGQSLGDGMAWLRPTRAKPRSFGTVPAQMRVTKDGKRCQTLTRVCAGHGADPPDWR
jgi:hypothetical protein